MKANRSPLGEFEIRGEWWLPESAADRVSGVLHYKAGSLVTLEADKPVRDPWVDTEPGIQQYSLVAKPFHALLGIAKDGTPCTLLDGFELGGVTIYARCLLTGGHFEQAGGIQIKSAEIQLAHMEEWSQHSPFRVSFAPAQESEPYAIDIAHTRKRLLAVQVPSRRCRVEAWSATIPSIHFLDRADVRHSVWLYVEPENVQDLSWYRQFFIDCCRLFSYFTGSRVVRIRTACVLANADKLPGDEGEIELFDQGSRPDTEPKRLPDAMPLPLLVIAPFAEQVFEHWFASAAELAPVYQVLMEVLPPSELGLESKLLRLAQALEIFYRRRIKETYVEPEMYTQYYEVIVRRFPEDMPPKLKDRLRNHLKYGNVYSLYSALKKMISSLDEPARNALRIEKPAEFAQLVANTRNSLTHRIQPDGPVASTAQQYVELTTSLRALLYGVIAQSLGLNTASVVDCIGKVLTQQ